MLYKVSLASFFLFLFLFLTFLLSDSYGGSNPTNYATYNTSEMSNSFLPRPPSNSTQSFGTRVRHATAVHNGETRCVRKWGRAGVGIKKKKRKTWEFNIVRVPRKPKGIYPLMFGIPERTLFFLSPFIMPLLLQSPLVPCNNLPRGIAKGEPSCTSTLKQHVFALHLSLCGEKSTLRLFSSTHPNPSPPLQPPRNPEKFSSGRERNRATKTA